MKKQVKKHPNFELTDYNYLKAKGYEDSEILSLWDRDLADGKGPCKHKPIPKIVEYLTGRA